MKQAWRISLSVRLLWKHSPIPPLTQLLVRCLEKHNEVGVKSFGSLDTYEGQIQTQERKNCKLAATKKYARGENFYVKLPLTFSEKDSKNRQSGVPIAAQWIKDLTLSLGGCEFNPQSVSVG